jgi:hypothetical protein
MYVAKIPHVNCNSPGHPKSLITGCPGAKFPHYFLYKEALLPAVVSSVYYSSVTA